MEPQGERVATGTDGRTMIGRADLDDRVRRWGLRDDVVEKDYVLGWMLWGIGGDPRLGSTWIFKGGTCLKKCYLETYRFSEDLDFTVLEEGPIQPAEVMEALAPVLDRIGQESGIDFTVRQSTLRTRPTGRSAEGRVYYRGPRGAPTPASIKLDLTKDELLVRPPVLRPISHDYPEVLPAPAHVRCYGFEEVFAEKLRAMGERARPRDLYDIVNLFRRREFRQHASLIRSILEQKCAAKGIPVPTVEAIRASPMFGELQTEWANMLAHQLQALPDFDQFWDEMPRLFDWLGGAAADDEAELAPLGAEDELWTPPATFWTTGAGNRLEPIRFAAANHLLVQLGYGGQNRLIEPYSLRRTRDGNIVLHAIRADSGEHRSYRVDRIQSVVATTHPFRPRYVVDFATAGPIVIAPAAPPAPRAPRVSSRQRTSRSGPTCIVACPVCGKHFRRIRRGTRLRPHKDPSGSWNCSGRIGYLDRIE